MKKLIIAITALLIQFTFISQSIAFFGWNEKESKPVAVIVNSELYPQIKDSIDRYLDDLKNEDYEVIFSLWDYEVYEAHPYVDDLKSLLKEYHETRNLQGAVLIGKIPYVLGEINGHVGPIEAYLIDLHNTDFIKNNEGIITSFEGPLNFNIWISRISSQNSRTLFPDESEADLINRYFEKNHLYRTCQSPVSDLKLRFFANSDSDFFGYHLESILEYSNSCYNNYDYLSKTGTSDEYLDFIKKNMAQYLVLSSHSDKNTHEFEKDILISKQIAKADIKQPFIILDACSANDFSHPESLGKAYLLGKRSDALVIAGASIPMNMIKGSTSMHSNKETFGLNYLDFFRSHNMVNQLHSSLSPPLVIAQLLLGFPFIFSDSTAISSHVEHELMIALLNYLGNTFGLMNAHQIGYTLLGDPTLKPYIDMDWCPEYQESTEL